MSKNKFYDFKFLPTSVACLALIASLSACNSTEDPSDQPPAAPVFNNLVSGPNLDGVWKSGCTSDWRADNQWQFITLTIAGQNITRHVDEFADVGCTQSIASRPDEQGLFRFDSLLGGGGYAVEYQFNMPFGTYSQYENYNLVGQTLFISDEISGDIVPTIALSQSSEPAPTPDPTTVHAPKIGDTVTYQATADGTAQTEAYTNQGFSELQSYSWGDASSSVH